MAREAERNAQRRQRAQERYRTALLKAQKLEEAAQAVRDYEGYIEQLLSIHKAGTTPIDWRAAADASEPTHPVWSHRAETEAKRQLEAFQPSVIDKWFRRVEKRQQALAEKVELARRADGEEYSLAVTRHESALSEFRERKELAERLLAGDGEAFIEVVKTLQPFSAISDLGSRLSVTVVTGRRMAVELDVQGEEIVPKESIGLLKSGRASVKALPKTQFHRLYQDYVCSAVLRVARELFAVVPADAVVVTASDEMLDTSTGTLEKQAILSVLVPKSTFVRLNLAAIDPSDSMKNFVHRMDFRPTVGFRPVTPLDPATVGLSEP